VIFRASVIEDLDALLDVQQEGAIRALSQVFAQDAYPFPRAVLAQRWREEIADPQTGTYVCTDDAGVVTGFAAIRAAELLHFGTAVASWGTGLARELHDAVLGELARTAPAGTRHVRLRVFEANLRARRFYEKLGWQPTGRSSRTSFPPHPVLIEYHRPLGAVQDGRA
jgi:RimJ/RimL family protein N-acetyltransferase